MRWPATYAFCAVVAAAAASPVVAQSVPEGQSCGGLLCDMGVFGHKTAPPPAPPPAVPAPSAERRAEALPPTAVEREHAAVEPRRHAAVKKKRIAKAAAPTVAVVARPAAPAVPVGTAAPAQPAPPTPRPASAASVSMNPYVQTGPVGVQFRPLY